MYPIILFPLFDAGLWVANIMKKVAKYISFIISSAIILIVGIPILMTLLLQIDAVQSWATNSATQMLTEKAGVKFEVGKINLTLFNRAELQNVIIQDHKGDTMIFVGKLDAKIVGVNFITGAIKLGKVNIDSVKVFLYRDSLNVMNAKKVFDNFKPNVPRTNRPNFNLSCLSAQLNNAQFKLSYYEKLKQDNGLNFKDIELSDIKLNAHDIIVQNYDAQAVISSLALKEKSGLIIQHLETDKFAINETGLRFDKARIQLPQTIIQTNHLNFLYASWWDYNDFVNRVTFDVDVLYSNISTNTISYFIKNDRIPYTLPLQFSGHIVGPIPRLVGEIKMLECLGTKIKGDFTISSLPDTKNATFDLNVNSLVTDENATKQLLQALNVKKIPNSINKILRNNEQIKLNGRFYGLLSEFDALCDVQTKQGKVRAELKVVPVAANNVKFNGNLVTRNFHIAQALEIKSMDSISVSAKVNGNVSAQGFSFNANAKIDSLGWNNYNYEKITMKGQFFNKRFDGLLKSEDENLKYDAIGTFDLTEGELPKFDFKINIPYADLIAINLNRRDSISTLKAAMTAKFQGSSLEDLSGTFNVDSATYINHRDTVLMDGISLITHNTPELNSLELKSPFADASLKGEAGYSDIVKFLNTVAVKYVPRFNDIARITGSDLVLANNDYKYAQGFYTLDVNVKQANNVASIFLPGIQIAEGTKLNFFFNPAQGKFSLDAHSDYIARGKFIVENIDIESKNIEDSLIVEVNTERLTSGQFTLPNFSLKTGVTNNQLVLDASFKETSGETSGALSTTIKLLRHDTGSPYIDIMLHPSNIKFTESRWEMPLSSIIIDSTGVEVNNWACNANEQWLKVNGKIGRLKSDTLGVGLDNFELSPFSFLTEGLGYKLKGEVNGNLKLVALTGDKELYAHLDMAKLMFGGMTIPDSKLVSVLNKEQNRIDVSITTQTKAKPLSGYYSLEEKRFNFDVSLPQFNMKRLEPLMKGVLTDTEGQANLELNVAGTLAKPNINGTVKVDNYKLNVDYTNVTYKMQNAVVNVANNRFSIDKTDITDPDGNKGTIEAYFDNDYFKNLRYKLSGSFTNLMALNTDPKLNPMFYGKAFGTGTVRLDGTSNTTNINVVAQTSDGSSIVMPFSDVSTTEQSSFIQFVDNKQDSTLNRKIEKKFFDFSKYNSKKGANQLDVKLDLNVLPNTVAVVEYDNSFTTNTIRGQGRGNLKLHINPTKDIFTLDGQMEIERGSYRLVIAIADKTFNLQPGGKIFWSGDPANPIVDFTGIYKVRASLQPLVGTGTVSSTASQAVNIDCGITLKESLFNPVISFEIKAPSATPESQNILRNALNTQEALQMQFMSLFISNSFIPDQSASGIGTMSGSIMTTTGFEFLSSQFSRLLSTQNFNFRPTYKPRSDISNEEIGFVTSINLVQNKVLIEAEGNYVTNNTTNNNAKPFTGGGNVTVMLNKSETLSLKGFTRVIDRFDETQGLQESGLGIYFRQDFQNWEDLKNKYKLYKQKLKENAANRKQKNGDKKKAKKLKKKKKADAKQS